MANQEDEEDKKVECPECKAGAPVWMATFADMATLLMAFFVLILSFSDTKVDKYKAVVGSLKNAFGMPKVQVIPKAASIISSDFSPSITTPAPVNILNQDVTDPNKEIPEIKQNPESEDFEIEKQKRKLEQLLQTEIMNAQVDVKIEGEKIVVQLKGTGVLGEDYVESPKVERAGVVTPERLGLVAKVSEAQKQIKAEVVVKEEVVGLKAAETTRKERDPKVFEKLEEQLTKEIAELKEKLKSSVSAGKIAIERRPDSIAIVLEDDDLFSDGGADINPENVKELESIRDHIMTSDAKVMISGHTDNVPLLDGGKYASNWELSSARAAAVAHSLTTLLGVPRDKLEIVAFADTKPIADNTTLEGRKKNRRVEILLLN